MATPPTLDVDDLLKPIPGERPAGRSLAYEPEYDALREARRSDDQTNPGEWKREVKLADWSAVVALGTQCLREKSKDLQIASWVAEALLHLHGFAGLRDGLGLVNGIQEQFWESYFPEIDDGDLESRSGPFLFLNDPRAVPFLIRSVPLTRGLGERAFSYEDYRASRETENALKKNPEKSKAILAEGRVTAKMFDDQVKQTPRAFYETLVDDLRQATAAFRVLDQGNDARFGPAAPSLLNVAKAIEDCDRLLQPILAAKRIEEPDPEPTPEPTPPPEIAEPPPPDGSPSPAADGSPAPRAESGADLGSLLIDFRGLAERLADAGTKLEQNRKRYEELRAELRTLDAEYEQIARALVRDGESHQLLRRVLLLQAEKRPDRPADASSK
jgi:type VI secretion system protein ImpA